MNPYKLCYKCSKHGTDCLFGKLSIKYFNYESNPPPKIKSIPSWIQLNMLFKTNDERKRRICDKIIHKATRITVKIHQTNKEFCVVVQLKNACKFEFADYLWLPFLDQP